MASTSLLAWRGICGFRLPAGRLLGSHGRVSKIPPKPHSSISTAAEIHANHDQHFDFYLLFPLHAFLFVRCSILRYPFRKI